jgi:putative tryptophan/tyrosine transport system substrate-binding protein
MLDLARRQFTLLGGAAVQPLAARAQQPAIPVVGFFNAGSAASTAHRDAAFRQGLRETGFVEGQNLAIEYRWGDDQYDRLPELAADLVQRRVAVIAASPRALDAAKAATATIPIVFMSGADPVRVGLVASLNRPGANVTGVTILASDLTAKRFGLLHEAVPQANVIGVLRESRADPFSVQEAEAAARQVGVSTRVMKKFGCDLRVNETRARQNCGLPSVKRFEREQYVVLRKRGLPLRRRLGADLTIPQHA